MNPNINFIGGIMKKLIMLLLLAAILPLSSCNRENRPNIDIENPSESYITEITDEKPVLKIYGMKLQDIVLETFPDVVMEEFGIDIEIVNGRYTFSEGISPAGLDGLLIYHRNPLDSIGHREDSFYPLNEYLKENETFNSLPPAVIEALKDKNGIIWYLPLGFSYSLDRRYCSDQIMSENNYKIPETVDELIELLGDVNEKYKTDEDFAVIYTDRRFVLNNLRDIIEAYGMIVNDQYTGGYGIIVWNEKTNRFEDTIINVDLEEFLLQIRYLSDSGIIRTEFSYPETSRNILWEEGNLFTYVGMYNRMQDNIISGHLSQDSVEHTINDNNSHLYVPLGVSDPKSTLDLFIDTFLATNKGRIIGKYGISDWFVEFDESYEYVRTLPEEEVKWTSEPIDDNGIRLYYGVGLVDRWFDGNYKYYTPHHSDEENEEINIQREQFSQYLRKAFEQASIVPLGNEKIINLNIQNDFNYRTPSPSNPYLPMQEAEKLFGDMLYDFINDNSIMIDEFIDNYFTKMKNLGVEEYLNNENEKIPGASRFSYGD